MSHSINGAFRTYNDLLYQLRSMRHNRLNNYIIPGLASSLVGRDDKFGKVRVFEAERQARDWVTPHSHRFNFTALVLAGRVHNTLFTNPIAGAGRGDEWCRSVIDQVCGADGIRQYTHTRDVEPVWKVQRTYTFEEGDTYSMDHTEIHSIEFEKGTVVLFFEGPQIKTTSEMLEPWVNGRVLPTFRTEDWMFEKGAP